MLSSSDDIFYYMLLMLLSKLNINLFIYSIYHHHHHHQTDSSVNPYPKSFSLYLDLDIYNFALLLKACIIVLLKLLFPLTMNSLDSLLFKLLESRGSEVVLEVVLHSG